MTRRRLVAALACLPVGGLFSWGNSAHGQPTERISHVTVLAPGFSADSTEGRAFRDGLSAAGYIEGRDLSIDWWYGHGSYSGISDAVAKAVQNKVDVIVVESTVAALAAKQATQTIPIVMALVADPVRSGLVQSLASPGGNITGLTNITTQLMAKRLELLKETVPGIRRVGIIWNPETPPHKIALDYLTPVAAQLRLALVPVAVNKLEQIEPAISTFSRSNANAVMVLDDPFMTDKYMPTIVHFATKARMPVIYGWKAVAKEGVLLSYASQTTELFQRAAKYVDKILKGASPATLPVEQPTKFELVVNLKTAKALGIIIPESILLRADEVIK